MRHHDAFLPNFRHISQINRTSEELKNPAAKRSNLKCAAGFFTTIAKYWPSSVHYAATGVT